MNTLTTDEILGKSLSRYTALDVLAWHLRSMVENPITGIMMANQILQAIKKAHKQMDEGGEDVGRE